VVFEYPKPVSPRFIRMVVRSPPIQKGEGKEWAKSLEDTAEPVNPEPELAAEVQPDGDDKKKDRVVLQRTLSGQVLAKTRWGLVRTASRNNKLEEEKDVEDKGMEGLSTSETYTITRDRNLLSRAEEEELQDDKKHFWTTGPLEWVPYILMVRILFKHCFFLFITVYVVMC